MRDLIVSVPDHCLSYYFGKFSDGHRILAHLSRRFTGELI